MMILQDLSDVKLVAGISIYFLTKYQTGPSCFKLSQLCRDTNYTTIYLYFHCAQSHVTGPLMTNTPCRMDYINSAVKSSAELRT